MSNFAIIPWSKDFDNDRIFETAPPINRDYLLEPYLEMKQEFESRGHVIHTIDLYDDYRIIDYFLFFSLEWSEYKKVIKSGKGNRMVYCTAEPPSVFWYNSPKGYRILKHIFPYILTWNDDWLNKKSIFKRNTPYYFADQRSGNMSFNEKKLITCIAGNKSSDYPGELYSERKNAIDFFEKNHPECFDLYGTGWDVKQHPCYKGRVENKAKKYHNYRFAICYENIEGLRGYITEKMLDCLVSGIVPIYAGSVDVFKYIPGNCYINLRDFKDYKTLYEYISGVTEDKYNEYLSNAETFLNSPFSDYFSGKRYAEYILEAVSHKKPLYRSSYLTYKVFKYIDKFHNQKKIEKETLV